MQKIFVAGHGGMVGSAICRRLSREANVEVLTASRDELDLTSQSSVQDFFNGNKVDQVYLAAAKVGGIKANNTLRADFIYQNLMIQSNVINSAYENNVQKLLFLGSSCIYPKYAPQPLLEDSLLTGLLEPTNEPYAIAKITGIKLCESYNDQFGTSYFSLMPTNLYGVGDNYNLDTSHVLPALIRKIFLARCYELADFDAILSDLNYWRGPNDELISRTASVGILEGFGIFSDRVQLWGTGKPKREFLWVDDLADACIHFMQPSVQRILDVQLRKYGFVNVGSGEEITIENLAKVIAKTLNYKGKIEFNQAEEDGTPRKLLSSEYIKTSGWKPRTSLKTGIKLAVADYTSRIISDENS